MTSIAEAARRAIQKDPCLQVVLARNLLNARGLAQQIKEEEGLDEDVDSIANAIRRYRDNLDPDAFEKVNDWLRATRLEIREDLAAITLDRVSEVARKLGKVHRLVEFDRGDALHILERQAAVTVILDGPGLKALKALFSEDVERDVYSDLTSVELVPPTEEGASAAVLHAALGCLRAHGFQITFVIADSERPSLLLPGEEGREAFQALDELTKD